MQGSWYPVLRSPLGFRWVLVAVGVAVVVLVLPTAAPGVATLLEAVAVLALGLVVGIARLQRHPADYIMAARAGILPALVALSGGAAAASLFEGIGRVVVSATTGGLVWLAIVAQRREGRRGLDQDGWAKLAQQALVYLSTFTLFALLYQTRERSLYTASGVALVAGLAALVLYRPRPERELASVLYALVTGLAVGEVTWAINYWASNALVGGATLLLVLYVIAGVVQAYLEGVLDRRVAAEYGAVALAGLALVLATAPWRA